MRLRTVPRVAELLLALALVAGCLGIVVGAAVAGAGLLVKQASDDFAALPDGLAVAGVPERSTLLDVTGRPFAYLWSQNRRSVPGSAMAPSMRDAVVAIEDTRFYTNKGVDVPAVLRAALHDVGEGPRQGGSTITQQYVKNLLLVQADSAAEQRAAVEGTYRRKLAEARYALALTQRMSKADILTGYLNLVYFGRGPYGLQAAAETFFATDAHRLSVPQAALLAGLVKSPAEFDPFTHPDAARDRRNLVIDRMQETGKLTAAAASAARAAPTAARDGAKHAGCYRSPAGYFCDWVLRQLMADDALGDTPETRRQRLDTGGLVVPTTLDFGVQRSAQRAVARAAGSRAALATVVQQPGTGAVLAMAASVPFGVRPGQSSVNLALGGSSGYQAGSTFKIFVRTHALQRNVSLRMSLYAPSRYTSSSFAPYNIVNGRPTPYTVRNAADSESGVFTLEEATWHSVNTYYMQLEERVGFTGPADVAEAMGVRRADGSPLHRVPSFTLGTNEVSPLAMAGAVATYAAHGRYCPAYGIVAITGVDWRRPTLRCRQVLDPRIADTVTRVLAGVIAHGTGRNAVVPGGAAGKTGTVQNFSAAWFVGYTPRYAAAVWMGDPRGGFGHPLLDLDVNGRHYERMYGGDLPAQVWAQLIVGAPGGRQGQPFQLRD
ncbi:MAG: transglycosylase domain-containing protein [Mycobacteriales bacterium]